MNYNKNKQKERKRLFTLITLITHESSDGEWTVSTDELRKEYNKGLPKAEKIIDLISVKSLVQDVQKPLKKKGAIRYRYEFVPGHGYRHCFDIMSFDEYTDIKNNL